MHSLTRLLVQLLLIFVVSYSFPHIALADITDTSSMEWLSNESRATPIAHNEQTVLVTPTPEAAQFSFMYPLQTQPIVTSLFSRVHRGTDYAAPRGSVIYAAETGVVTTAGFDNTGYGLTVILHHTQTIYTRYAHMSAISVGGGQFVRKGSPIGYVGCTGHCTGPHVHFEVNVNGEFINPQTLLAFGGY